MKRLLPLLALAMLFGGCGLDTVGLPTLAINLKSSDLSPVTTASGVITSYRRTAVLEFRALPGSPAGRISSFTTQNGETFPGGAYLDSCPTSSKSDCAPYTFTISFSFADPSAEPKIIILTYRVEGGNNSSKDVQLPGNGIAIN